jgi:signal transduction histidine kinase
MSGPLTQFGIEVETREQRQERILDGVLASVYRQVPQSVLGNLVGGVALVAAFWNTHSQNLLVGWFIAMLVEALIRLRAARRFRESPQRIEQVHAWASRWVALAASSGALWGAAGVLFFVSGAALQQLVLVSVILGVAFGSLTIYATHRPALFAFLPLALLPLIGRLVAEQDPAYYTAAIVMFAVFGFTGLFGRNFGETMFESVRNNLDNVMLVDQLQHEKRMADEARREAESATLSKTQFFAAASHDLRQPLQAIGIYTSLLRKRAEGPSVPLVRNLATAVGSLSNLVEELLEISRLDSGSIQPRVETLLLSDLLPALEQEFAPVAAAKKGLSLRVRNSHLAIESDNMLLLRVLRNLIANAIRYTPRGRVLLGARRRGELVSIEVWDNGPGIKQTELDRIFEEFYRGESSKGDSGGGFGLGLSIVRRICSVLGHPLVVTTRLGAGTVFRIEVPCAVGLHDFRRPATDAGEAVLRDLAGQRLVVLEDHEAILTSLTDQLRSWGAEVVPATHFGPALVARLSSDNRVHGILADHNLGNSITGVEAALRIREIVGYPVPVVMLTAVQGNEVQTDFQRAMQERLARNPDMVSVIARGRDEQPVVLQKPTPSARLNAAIADALGVGAAAASPARPAYL